MVAFILAVGAAVVYFLWAFGVRWEEADLFSLAFGVGMLSFAAYVYAGGPSGWPDWRRDRDHTN
jgi:uncharacterized membrane protein YfcA